LGPEKTVKSVEIRWPGGHRQILEGVKADAVLRVEEPE
jgi:hypothetical protein